MGIIDAGDAVSRARRVLASRVTKPCSASRAEGRGRGTLRPSLANAGAQPRTQADSTVFLVLALANWP